MKYSKMQALLEEAESAIQTATMAPPEQAATLMRQTIEMLENSEALASSRVCCALGCCWHHLPQGGANQARETELWLHRALALDSTNHCARLYLGYLLFEVQRYEEARGQLLQVPDGVFAARGQAWMELKKEELILCCELFLKAGDVDLANLRRVCTHYAELPEDDTPVPLELVRAFAWLVKHPEAGACPRDAIQECTALIGKLGLSEALGPELRELRARL